MKILWLPLGTEYWRSTFVIAFAGEDKVIIDEADYKWSMYKGIITIWYKERVYRFLASSFQLIAKWQRERVRESFVCCSWHEV